MPEPTSTGLFLSPRTQTLAKDLGLVLAGTLVTAASAQVSVPLQPVPFTLQTLGVTVCGLTLGARRGAASQIAYIAAGVAGAPVFAGGAGGIQHLFGPTGGYLVAFVLAAGLLGWIADRGWNRHIWQLVAGLAAANALILFLGAAWLAAFVGVASAWALGVVPFVWGAFLKSIIAMATVPNFWRRDTRSDMSS